MNAIGERDKYPYHRKFIRHRVRVRIEVQQTRTFDSWTINLSPDGLCFEIPTLVDLNESVGVWVFLTRGKKKDPPVQGTARVVWHEQGRKKHKHGAQFTDFETDGKERLAKWLGSGVSRR